MQLTHAQKQQYEAATHALRDVLRGMQHANPRHFGMVLATYLLEFYTPDQVEQIANGVGHQAHQANREQA